MIRTAVDRSRPTRNSMIVSTGVHILLLILLIFAARPGGPLPEMAEELTKVTYIEARHNENVAEKVRLRTLAKRTPVPKSDGGISTRSAIKPKSPGRPKVDEGTPKVADVDMPMPAPTERPQVELEQAARLQSRSQDLAQIDVPTQSARGSRAVADTEAAPQLTSRAPRGEYDGAQSDLTSRRHTLDVAGGDIDPSLPSGTSGTGPAIADAGSSALGGGSLQGKGGGPQYRSPGSSLAPARRGSGVADVAGGDAIVPGGNGGGGSEGGRRTILDYGSGGGGGLRSRGGGAIAEGPGSVTDPVRPSQKAQDRIAEGEPTQLKGNGSDMTISGQISGRNILKVVPPTYSEKAKRNGWEGLVAVHFTVLPDGRVKDNLFFEQTSAHRDLNRAAMEAIRKFRFAPLPSGDPQVEQWGVITFVFRLK